MSSLTRIFLDQKKNGEEIPLNMVLKAVKEGLNTIILNSYDANDVSKNELGRLPLIRNRSRVDSFDYNPCSHQIGDQFGDKIAATFNIFVKEDEVGGFPKDEFKFKNPKMEVHHQRRYIDIYTNLNCDAKNYIPNISDTQNKFMIFGLGDDVVGQRIMKELAIHLQNVLGTEVYYQRSNLSDDITQINPPTITKKIKP